MCKLTIPGLDYSFCSECKQWIPQPETLLDWQRKSEQKVTNKSQQETRKEAIKRYKQLKKKRDCFESRIKA